LTLPFTILAAFLGSCSGITVSYLIGRIPGLALLKKYGKYIHFTEERVDRIISGSKKWGNGCS
jgi:membrane protein DedA with SNARE-associated domain